MRCDRSLILVVCVAGAACSPGSIITSTISDNTWTLRATADNALVDEQSPDRAAYPNPRNVEWMRVTLTDDGTLCANDGARGWCGGPLQGIPYVTVLSIQQARYCVRVIDMYGNQVRSGCAQGVPDGYPVGAAQQKAGAQEAVDLAPGTGDDAPVDQAQPPRDGVTVGAALVIESINDSLARIGLKARVSLPTGSKLADFDQGEITIGKGTCEDVREYLDDEFSDDHEGTDDWVFGDEAIKECLEDGRCRIGQIVTRAMAAACSTIPDDVETFTAESGIIGGGGHAIAELCGEGNDEIERCVGSPLVLDLGGDGLKLKGLDATFPLAGERPMQVGWTAGPEDGLLVLDVDGDGAITSGRELFGEATNGWAPNGFAALARHDDDGDGAITPSDPVFERLRVWRDDGDARSTREELSTLAALGISRIPLGFTRIDQVDRFGNELGLLGAATGAGGRSIPVIDVWFRMRHRQRQGRQ